MIRAWDAAPYPRQLVDNSDAGATHQHVFSLMLALCSSHQTFASFGAAAIPCKSVSIRVFIWPSLACLTLNKCSLLSSCGRTARLISTRQLPHSDAVAMFLARWRIPPLTDLTGCQSVPAVVAVPVFGVSAFAHSKLYGRECFTVHAGRYPRVSRLP